MSDEQSFVDLIETSVVPLPAEGKRDPKAKLATELPESVVKEMGAGGLGASDEELNKQRLEKLAETRKQQQELTKLRMKDRLNNIKSNATTLAAASDFLLDMAGVNPMTREYSPFRFLKVTFRVMNSSITEEIAKQTARDAVVGRIQFTNEPEYYQTYRLAGSVKSLTLCDPQQPDRIHKHYDYDASLDELLSLNQPQVNAKLADGDLVSTDLLIRRRALYFTHVLLKSSTLFLATMRALGEFEQLLSDLSFLASEDPDFFQQCLTGAT